MLQTIIDTLLAYAYYYPLFMSYVWMCGAIYYRFHWESTTRHDQPPPDASKPGVSILVPCYNEADNIAETLRYLSLLDYPEFEIICINDGSKDDTGIILDELSNAYPKLRVVHMINNGGKARALNAGALVAKHEILVCIDSDAVLDPHAVTWLARH